MIIKLEVDLNLSAEDVALLQNPDIKPNAKFKGLASKLLLDSDLLIIAHLAGVTSGTFSELARPFITKLKLKKQSNETK